MRNINININSYERIADTIFPLVVMALVLTMRNRGFDTVAPIIGCVVYSFIQPFIRVFVFDRLRVHLLNSQQPITLLVGAATVYGALALLVCGWVA